jgi:hypothetical protein
MPLPKPEAGLVVRYNYLWRDDHKVGRQGAKTRPACILLAMPDLAQIVLVPITHTRPDKGVAAIEIPSRVKQHLGLDGERSWVIVQECNVDAWPSPDLSPIPGTRGRYAYGFVPPGFHEQIKRLFVKTAEAGRLGRINRG